MFYDLSKKAIQTKLVDLCISGFNFAVTVDTIVGRLQSQRNASKNVGETLVPGLL